MGIKTWYLSLFAIIAFFNTSIAQNDEQVIGDAVFTPQEVAEGATAMYLVRFQNVYSDTAYQVVLRDTLDARMEVNTFTMLAASHDFELLRDGSNVIRWYFTDIQLPDSTSGGPESFGFVLFSVAPKSFLNPGQVISNRTCIYFDNNLPICTNNANIWIDADAAVDDPEAGDHFKVVPNPNYGQFEVRNSNPNTGQQLPAALTEWWITDISGKIIWDGKASDPATAGYQVRMEKPSPGLYLLWLKCDGVLKVNQFAVIR